MWVYRFFLFIGIAALVYLMFFKVLGAILFVIEILWLILMPILNEIKHWWKIRSIILKRRRAIFSGIVAAAILAASIVPWSSSVSFQGVALAEMESIVFAPRPARISAISMVEKESVISGQTLLRLEAPDLDQEIRQARLQINLVQHRLARIAGDDRDLSNLAVLQRELVRHQTNLGGLEVELQKLVVKAPHEGAIRDMDRDLRSNEWIDPGTPITRVVKGGTPHVKGYVSEDDLWRLEEGAFAIFVPEDPTMVSRRGRVVEIVENGVNSIDLFYLASVYGGAVPTDRSADNVIKPRSGRHLVSVALDGPATDRVFRGTLRISGKSESFASSFLRRLLQVLVRESSA